MILGEKESVIKPVLERVCPEHYVWDMLSSKADFFNK